MITAALYIVNFCIMVLLVLPGVVWDDRHAREYNRKVRELAQRTGVADEVLEPLLVITMQTNATRLIRPYLRARSLAELLESAGGFPITPATTQRFREALKGHVPEEVVAELLRKREVFDLERAAHERGAVRRKQLLASVFLINFALIVWLSR